MGDGQYKACATVGQLGSALNDRTVCHGGWLLRLVRQWDWCLCSCLDTLSNGDLCDKVGEELMLQWSEWCVNWGYSDSNDAVTRIELEYTNRSWWCGKEPPSWWELDSRSHVPQCHIRPVGLCTGRRILSFSGRERKTTRHCITRRAIDQIWYFLMQNEPS